MCAFLYRSFNEVSQNVILHWCRCCFCRKQYNGDPEHELRGRRRLSKSGQASPPVVFWHHRFLDVSPRRQLRRVQRHRETTRENEQKTHREEVHLVRRVTVYIVRDVQRERRFGVATDTRGGDGAGVPVPDVFGDEDEQVFTMRRYWILVI